MIQKLVLATHNKHKVFEVKHILNFEGLEILTLDDLGITEEPVENGATFKENAFIKAYASSQLTPWPVVADDSGLCVDALKGEPGVKSKRFSAEETDEANNKLMLEKLCSFPKIEDRSAHYTTAICYIDAQKNIFYFEGQCLGYIGFSCQGHNGFGYDPLFVSKDYGKTFAECSPEEKDRCSHRGKAFKAFKEYLVSNK